MYLLDKINLSRLPVLAAALCVCWLFTVFAADQITVWMTWLNFGALYPSIIQDLRFQTLFTSSVLSIPLFTVFLLFIRHIDMLRKKLENVVRKDGLTGILSREAFLDDFRNELAAASEETQLQDAFLIVDADFFKRINDTHGHVAGDRALIAITNALKKGVRSTDSIGRLGGEEFAVHLRNVSHERAEQVAERIRQLVVDASPEADIPDLKLTVSIGAVTFKKKRDAVDLLIAADKLLYRAKNNGRDRVELCAMEAASGTA